jgi:hypothetical protein
LGARDTEELFVAAARYLARVPPLPARAEDRGPLDIETWVGIASDERVRDDGVSGAGVHTTTLLDALLFSMARLDAVDRDVALGNASVWLAKGEGRPAADMARRAVLDDAVARVTNDEKRFLAAERARLTATPRGEHDFKYVAAVEAVAALLSGEARIRWLAHLALG